MGGVHSSKTYLWAMRLPIHHFCFALLVCAWSPVAAQRFSAGLQFAGQLSQIDGDDAFGFNKAGYGAGGFVSAKLSRTTALEVGLGYSLRGSRSGKNEFLRVAIDLHYVEVPILFIVHDWQNRRQEMEYYQMEFFGGIALGRLISSSSLTGVDKDFNKKDVSWILGAGYRWSPRWGGFLKYTRALNSLYGYSKNGVPVDLTSYFLSLGLKVKIL